jgi:hypothetical protein
LTTVLVSPALNSPQLDPALLVLNTPVPGALACAEAEAQRRWRLYERLATGGVFG